MVEGGLVNLIPPVNTPLGQTCVWRSEGILRKIKRWRTDVGRIEYMGVWDT